MIPQLVVHTEVHSCVIPAPLPPDDDEDRALRGLCGRVFYALFGTPRHRLLPPNIAAAVIRV